MGDGSLFGGDFGDHGSYVDVDTSSSADTPLDGIKDSVFGWGQVDKIHESIVNIGNGQDVAGGVAEIGVQVADFAGNVGGILADPIGWLISAGLGVIIDFVQPLEDLLGLVTGNPERMDGESKKWDGVVSGLQPIAKSVREAASDDLKEWAGAASEIAKRRLNQLADGVDGVCQQIAWLQGIMQVAGALASVIQDIIKTEIGSFIGQRVIAWAVATSTAAVSFGASFAAFIANTLMAYSRTVLRVTRYMNTATSIFARILKLMSRLGEWIGNNGALFAAIKQAPGLLSKGINSVGTTNGPIDPAFS